MNRIIIAGIVAVALIVGCSREQEPAAAAGAAAKSSDKTIAADDGGIPLSSATDASMARYRQVRELADAGDFIEANQAARKLTEEFPDFIGGWIMLANTALSGEQFVKASRKADQMSAKGTQGEQLWADINMSFVSNDTEEGVRLGKKLVETYPDAPRAWIVHSGLLTGQFQHEEARAASQKAIELAPQLAIAHTNLAFSLLYNEPKDHAEAERHFRHAIEIDPDEDNYYVNLGDMHRAMTDLGAARQAYSRALELDAENEVAAIKRGHVNSFLGNFDEARGDYDTGIAAGQEVGKSTLANYRAFVNLHAGDSQAAIDELRGELTRIDTLEMPADQRVGARIFVLTNIADISFNYGLLDEAADAVERLTAALAESGQNSGDDEYARQTEATAVYWQGKLAARRDDFDAASALADDFEALVADDDNPRKMERYHELHGLIALKQGNFKSAIQHYRKANLSMSPGAGDVKNSFMLAKALEGAGRSEEAQALYKQVANWNFNSVWFAMLRKDAAAKA